MRNSLLLPAFLLAATAAPAQTPERPDSATDSSDAACETAPISYIFIDNHSIFDTSDPALDGRFEWAYDLANSLHARTRAPVIRRELLFQKGDCFEPFLLEESERLLRAHDFLSRVDVFAVEQPDGTYHAVVDTQDEWSTQVDLRVGLEDGIEFEGIQLREANLFGTGRSIGLFYFEREVAQDYGAVYETPQFLGTRWDLRVSGGRSRAGSFYTGAVAYPFVGEVGRWAALQSFVREDRFFQYIARDDPDAELHVLAPLRNKAVDLAVVTRLGERGRLTLLGGAVTFRELTFPGGPGGILRVAGDDFDERTPAGDALAGSVLRQQSVLHNIRLMLLLGQRNIRWVERRGFDSLRGEEDIRLGVEAELAIGRSLPMLLPGDDLFATAALYTGFEAGSTLVATHLRADGRRDFTAPAGASEWEDVFAEGELLAYWKPPAAPSHTFLLRAAGTGGWHTRTPFQLTLGGDRALRGYDPERFPGGRRTVFTLEDRIYFGWPFADVLDLGGTLFMDAGRIWPGDAPFGVDSGWRASVGIGLRAAFPAGGRTTYRLDLALPLEDGASWDDVRLIVSVGELRGLAAGFGDPQLGRSRGGGVSAELFHFPN